MNAKWFFWTNLTHYSSNMDEHEIKKVFIGSYCQMTEKLL